jgi:hypothetical protein
VLLKDFGKHVERTSQQLKAASLQAAGQAGRTSHYGVVAGVVFQFPCHQSSEIVVF